MDDNIREVLAQYQVSSPAPTQYFRAICLQLTRLHENVYEIFSSQFLVQLFTEIHLKFKQRLRDRLRELNITNDGSSQPVLVMSDLTYYLKQFKNMSGLHLIPLNLEDVWIKQTPS